MSGRAKPTIADLSPEELRAIVDNDTSTFVDAGKYEVPAAIAQLHEWAEAGDTASQRMLVDLGDAGSLADPAAPVQGTVALTLPGIASNLHDLLAKATLDLVDIAKDVEGLHSVGAVEIGNLAALASAFRDVDAVLARIRAEAPRDTGPTAEAFLSAVWDESQRLGLEIAQADILVGKLRARIAPE